MEISLNPIVEKLISDFGLQVMNNKRYVKIKICGLTRPVEAEFLNECNVDYAGFVFYEKSRRNISIEKAEEIMKELDRGIKRVAVTVAPDAAMINKLSKCDFDIIQIHKELCEDAVEAAGIPIWLALNIKSENDIGDRQKYYENMLSKHNDKINGVVLDASDFGSGKPFDWHKSRRLLKAGDRSSPLYEKEIILAGGLNSLNVAEGIRLFDPDTVDVSTNVEDEYGKSKEKIQRFAEAVRSAGLG